jgi:hypothetical protein
MTKKFYVIEFDRTAYVHVPESNTYNTVISRGYYVSSAAKSVDPTNINYAKLFPTMRSAKQAWVNASQNPKYYEVDVEIKIAQEVKI